MFEGNAIAFFDNDTDTTVYADLDASGSYEFANDMQIVLAGTGLGLAASDYLL